MDNSRHRALRIYVIAFQLVMHKMQIEMMMKCKFPIQSSIILIRKGKYFGTAEGNVLQINLQIV